MKPNICIVADIPNWAFDNIAQKLKKELSYKYNIRIVYFDRRKEADCLFELIEGNKDCELIHFLNRRMLLLIGLDVFKEKVEKNGYLLKEYIKMVRNKCSTAVYDYMDIDLDGIKEHTPIFNVYTKKYYTATKKLFEIYSGIKEYNKPSAMVHDICDETKYVPMNLERFDNIYNRSIVVGWVGNSLHSGDNGVDLKGFSTVLKPVMNELKEEGYNFEECYADRNVEWRAAEEMPEYYSNIDVCICVSVHEGTPRPVLEAMHSGVPVISTDVGIVPEAFGKKQRKFNIGSRNGGKSDSDIRRKLKESLIYLYNHRECFDELSQENLISIKEFDGGKTIRAFENFFDECLSTEEC